MPAKRSGRLAKFIKGSNQPSSPGKSKKDPNRDFEAEFPLGRYDYHHKSIVWITLKKESETHMRSKLKRQKKIEELVQRDAEMAKSKRGTHWPVNPENPLLVEILRIRLAGKERNMLVRRAVALPAEATKMLAAANSEKWKRIWQSSARRALAQHRVEQKKKEEHRRILFEKLAREEAARLRREEEARERKEEERARKKGWFGGGGKKKK